MGHQGQARPVTSSPGVNSGGAESRSATTGTAPRKEGRSGSTTDENSTPPENADSSDFDSSSDDASDEGKNTKPSRQRRPKASDRISSLGHLRKKERTPTLSLSKFVIKNQHMHTQGKVSKTDGRLKLSLNEKANSGFFARTLGAGLKHHIGNRPDKGSNQPLPPQEELQLSHEVSQILSDAEKKSMPKLNIVIMVIGSRGDIQPFIKIGKILTEEHGHRVRVATHPAFKKFVEEDNGLEFFSVGGDPSELMAFMVKNPGLVPSLDTVRKGEIGRRRDQMYEMFNGFWQACIQPSSADGSHDEDENPNTKPFVADAIIANPPSFAHVHCAERLGCPLHIMFTFPYTPTQEFPHPLANIKPGNVDANYTNFMSYPLVEMMTWQGLGDLVNKFRVETLGIDPVSTIWAPGQLYRLKVPYTYLWSPGLVPKPPDWGDEIHIAGFVFLAMADQYKAADDLQKFLDAGDPPIYIGFGSIVVDDPKRFTKMIFGALEKAGVRAVINEGWGGIGDKDNTPDHVFMLDNVPHDWLFPRCKAVVHHGGAGTTAIGLKCAKPTMIVPFFGDQPFWGSMVAAAKAGAHECIPYKDLTAETLANGIKQCLEEEAQRNVQKIADSIAKDGDGAANAVDTFLASLPMKGPNTMRCGFLDGQTAGWTLKKSHLRLSPLAAEILVRQGKLGYDRMRLLREYEWNDFQGSGGPLTGVSTAVFRTVTGFGKGTLEGPMLIGKDIHKHAHYEKKKMQKKRREHRRKDKLFTAANDQNLEDVEARNRSIANKEMQPNESLPQSTQRAGTMVAALRKESSKDPGGAGSDSDSADTDAATAVEHPQPRRAETQASIQTTGSLAPSTPLAKELARDTARGLAAPLEALATAPMDILLGIGQGLHNLPRLYNDTTVRRPHRIHGLHSGLVAARDSFMFGAWDAVTGVVTQPWNGAREGLGKTDEEGRHGGDGGSVGGAMLGFTSGMGKGVGGLVLKGTAAVINPVAFTMKGVHMEMTKGRTPLAAMRDARIKQGWMEWEELSEQEKKAAGERVEAGWRVMKELWRHRREMVKEHGVKGRVMVLREMDDWKRYGALENVDVAKKAMEARKKGVPFEKFMSEPEQSGWVEGGQTNRSRSRSTAVRPATGTKSKVAATT